MIKKIKDKFNKKTLSVLSDLILLILIILNFIWALNEWTLGAVIRFFMFMQVILVMQLISMAWSLRENNQWMKRVFWRFR